MMINQHKKKYQENGFTLLEVLVVIVIIGILASIGLGSFFTSQVKSRDAKRKSDLAQIAKALELYHTDKGHYPVDDESGHIRIWYEDGGEDESETFAWGDKFDDPLQDFTIYMATLPQDPVERLRYYYQSFHFNSSASDGYDAHFVTGTDKEAEAYKLFAKLENDQDSQIIEEAVGTDCDTSEAGTTLCNYVLTSLNIDNSVTYINFKNFYE